MSKIKKVSLIVNNYRIIDNFPRKNLKMKTNFVSPEGPRKYWQKISLNEKTAQQSLLKK